MPDGLSKTDVQVQAISSGVLQFLAKGLVPKIRCQIGCRGIKVHGISKSKSQSCFQAAFDVWQNSYPAGKLGKVNHYVLFGIQYSC